MKDKKSSNTSRNRRTRPENESSLGDCIRRARQAAGMSISALARAVDVHHSSIARLESGDHASAKPALLQRLSRVLEVDDRDLFTLAGLDAPEALPAFTPYLRAKYEMSDEAARSLERHFERIRRSHRVRPRDPRGPAAKQFEASVRPSRPDHPAYDDPTLAGDQINRSPGGIGGDR